MADGLPDLVDEMNAMDVVAHLQNHWTESDEEFHRLLAILAQRMQVPEICTEVQSVGGIEGIGTIFNHQGSQ